MENKKNMDYILNTAKLIINEEVEKAVYLQFRVIYML